MRQTLKATLFDVVVAGLALVLLTGASLTPTPTHAQTRVGEKIGDWTFQCQAISAKETICAIAQVFANQQTRQPVLVLTIRALGIEKKLMLFARAPLGIYLPEPIVATIDDGPQLTFAWQVCSQQGCEASAEINDESRAAMKAGNRMQIAFKAQAGSDPVTFNASLKGVTQGLVEIGAE